MNAASAPARPEANLAVFRLDPEQWEAPPQRRPSLGDRDWIEPLWHQNAIWFCRLRWLVVAVLGAAGVVAGLPALFGSLGLDRSPQAPWSAALVLASLNLLFATLAQRRGRGPVQVPVQVLLWAQIVCDLLVLTAVVRWLGDEWQAAPFMYLFHIILACIVFSPWQSLAVAGLAAGFYLASLGLASIGEWGPPAIPGPESGWMDTWGDSPRCLRVGSMLVIWSVIWYLVSRLASALRARDRELYISNRRLRASIEERLQHMLQTTHQLKAPFAAIHAQSQLLLGGYCGTLSAEARAAVERISERCLVLARQIQEMLQLANLRSQGQDPPVKRPLDVGHLVEDVIARLEPSARQRGVHFRTEIEPVTVEAVQDHLTMLMDNLLVNAVNYSYPDGVVQVDCRSQPAGAVITIRDQGIGIPSDKLPRIFDDYYRTEEAVQHNRGSTGLGLAIVRQVACKDRVPITVESAPGWGTRFTVTLAGSSGAAGLRPPLNSNN